MIFFQPRSFASAAIFTASSCVSEHTPRLMTGVLSTPQESIHCFTASASDPQLPSARIRRRRRPACRIFLVARVPPPSSAGPPRGQNEIRPIRAPKAHQFRRETRRHRRREVWRDRHPPTAAPAMPAARKAQACRPPASSTATAHRAAAPAARSAARSGTIEQRSETQPRQPQRLDECNDRLQARIRCPDGSQMQPEIPPMKRPASECGDGPGKCG